MSAKNWKFSYKGNGKTEIKQHILDTISLWGAMGLLWYSFLLIIKEHFPEFLEVTVEIENISLTRSSYVGPSAYETYGLDWFIIGIFLVVLWLGYDWPKKYLKKFSLPCHLTGGIIPIAYVLINFEKVADGVVRLAWFYLPHWNSYYKQNLYMGIANNNENSVVAFTALCMILWWLVWALSYTLKRRILLILFPVIALSVELLVGLSPRENGLFFALFGAMLLTTLGGSSVVKKAIVLACVGISLSLTGGLFGEDIEDLATEKKKQEILQLQKDFNIKEFSLAKLFQIDFHFDWEKLGNNAPQFSGKTVLEIESNEQPVSTVYIKGFYGTSYDNGNWNFDDSTFRKACREAGKSTEEVAKQIFQMPYDSWETYEKSIVISNKPQGIEYKIRYTGTTGDVAYIPYATDYASFDESYTLMGDYLFKKSILDREITCKGQNFHYELSGWQNVNRAIENGIVDKTEEFINELSDAYLQIPEELTEFLAQESVEIEADMKYREIGISYDGIPYDGTENNRRIHYGAKVAHYLASNMWYSMKLDELPADMDPIEYALTESHEGYCMHFASAATLLLRQGGVPARYVSGYAVDRSAFVYDAETGAYIAEVGDYMAHAWVEIYLENIGWVPLEVTPGSSLENLPSQDDMDRWESLAEAHRNDRNDEQTQSESEESETIEETEETESQSEDSEAEPMPSESESASDSRDETPNDSEQENPNGGGSGAGNILSSEWIQIFGVAVVVLLFIIGVGIFIHYGVKRYNNELKTEIEKKLTKKAVNRINRRMYRMLRLQNPKLWFARKLSDIEYEQALVMKFTEISADEWHHFMDIVKKNHYSDDRISIEEMQYCYECYKSCIYKKRK